jgi:hypothetical protein
MSFLAPLFLVGAVAVGLPIFLHLIRRSSKEQMTFSSLMFLRPDPPRLTKRSRLEHILLLLLRCLVICLLALAFARPFVQRSTLANQPPDTGHKIIVLVDTSASMQRDGMWAAALAKAGDALAQTSPGDQVAVFTFDNQAHALVTFAQWSDMKPGERVGLANTRLAGVKPGWAATHLGHALTAAAEAFTEADKKGQLTASCRIVLVSDLQEGSRLDGLQGYDWPRGLAVQLETIQPKRPTNAGLQWVVEKDDSAKSDAAPGTRIRVSNSANAKEETFQLRWDGVTGVPPLDVYVPPGQNRIVAAPALPTNSTATRLLLTGDDDVFDDSVYVIQPRTEKLQVLFLGDEAEKDATQPLYFLKRAFQQTPRLDVEIKPHPLSAPTTTAELAAARLLIVTDLLPDSQLVSVQSFLAGGGTVLFVLKHAAAVGTLGSLAGVDGLTAIEVTAPNYAMLGQIDFEHPLFAPFADPRYNDFTRIHFWKYRKLDAAKLPKARVLAKFDGGDPALLEMPRGKGRILILTSGWQPVDSQLALSSKFVPLLYGMLDLAGGHQAALTQFHIGEPVELTAAAEAGPVVVRKPDGAEVRLAAGESRFSQTDLPGIYTVASVQPPVSFVVNLDPAESRTAPLPVDQLEQLGVPLKPQQLDAATQVELKRRLHDTELEDQQKLWRWLTFAAVVVLLVETWLAGWMTRRPVAQAEAGL